VARSIRAISAARGQPERFLVFAALTFVLGAAFLFLETRETPIEPPVARGVDQCGGLVGLVARDAVAGRYRDRQED
jgi:hypothetical protein